jgi:hypothetical protein
MFVRVGGGCSDGGMRSHQQLIETIT